MMMMMMTALAAGMQQRWSLQQLAEEQHMPTSPADTLIIANDGDDDDDEYHGDDVDENCDDYVLWWTLTKIADLRWTLVLKHLLLQTVIIMIFVVIAIMTIYSSSICVEHISDQWLLN